MHSRWSLKYQMRIFLFVSFYILVGVLNAEDITVVSWNLKDFGQSRDESEINLIAKEIQHADVVAIQEVVAKHPGGAKAVARLVDKLNRMGDKWDYRISDPTDSPSPHISERYAFIWKSSKLSLSGGRPYLVKELATIVDREPFVAEFKLKNNDKITLINYHACTHKKDYPERTEIVAISQWLKTNDFENVFWVGDMNLEITDIAFDSIKKQGYIAALNGEKTSLKKSCQNGNYLSSAEDNILYKLTSLNVSKIQLLDFVVKGDCNDVTWKRNSYSDHLGVEIKVGK